MRAYRHCRLDSRIDFRWERTCLSGMAPENECGSVQGIFPARLPSVMRVHGHCRLYSRIGMEGYGEFPGVTSECDESVRALLALLSDRNGRVRGVFWRDF